MIIGTRPCSQCQHGSLGVLLNPQRCVFAQPRRCYNVVAKRVDTHFRTCKQAGEQQGESNWQLTGMAQRTTLE